MTKQERSEKLQSISSRISSINEDLIHYTHELEELGCKAEAKKLDTVTGKLYNLEYDLYSKTKK